MIKGNKIAIGLLLIIMLCCGDDESSEDMMSQGLEIEDVILTDANGQGIGCYPECDDDWSDFGLNNIDALNFEDSIVVSTTETDGIDFISVYPNPFDDVQNLMVSSPHDYKLKLAIVDKNNEIKFQYAAKVSQSYSVVFNYEAVGIKHNELYRMYYRFLNADENVVFEGYGDIYGCDSPVDYIDCYPN